VTLDIDIDPSISLPGDAADVSQLLQVLVGQSLAEMQEHDGELSFVAWQGPTCLELEIADSGCPVEERAASLPMIAGKLGSSLIRQNCPQGGAAVTVRFPLRLAQREAA